MGSLTTEKKIELTVTFLVGLFLFVLGATRVASAYTLYSAEGSIANFLWVQFTGLLVAFGATGVIVVLYQLLVQAVKGGDNQ